jgi:hypothetical protein
MLVAFAFLRVLAVRTTPLLYHDTDEYRRLQFLGGRRPWTVPLFFWFMPSDQWRIVEQALISAVAWVTVALVVAAAIDDRWIRRATIATFLAVGLTTQITNWDTAILSDSITISLTVLLIASWIAVYRAPGRWSVVGVLAATTLWTFSRELHLYITAAVAVLVAVVVVVRRLRSAWRIVAVGLVLISGLAVAQSRSNQNTAVENLAGVIGARVLPDRNVRQWFVDAGMPAMPQLAVGQFHPDKELLALPDFNRWARGSGWWVFGRYLLTHPRAAIPGPYGELLEERPTYADEPPGNAVLLSPAEAYGRSRPVLPAGIENVLFNPGRTGSLLTFAAVALGGTLILRSRTGPDRRRHIPIIAIVVALAYVALAWHGSVYEPGRHAMPAAAAVRVGLFALLAVIADGAVSSRGQMATEAPR